MNKNKLKSYAPAARREFIQAVTDRANAVGLFSDKDILPLEVKGDIVIIGGKNFPVKVAEQRKKLEQRIARDGFEQAMEAVAYTWFNRFVALRYMELHDYLNHGYRVLSNRNGSPMPEILEHAVDLDLSGINKETITDLKLDGGRDAELYRMLLVAQCNALHTAMPFLFERIGGETELLLPDNLLHSDSLIRKIANEVNEEDWREVEIIGWLYQFYISEKKDQVIGKVVKSEDIPAATQLFTPNWIVKYMVQNTLGRQWLATYPNSPLREKMEYYIEPAEQTEEVQAQLASITPKELDPETLTLLDPACGSGHILVEAYELFKEMYLERGYRTRDIPRLILEKNLYGVEIDDRAAQLAGFAVLMKARRDDRRILGSDNPVQLNIMAIQESKDLDGEQIARVLLQERVIRIGTAEPQQQELFQPRATQLPLSKTEKPEVNWGQIASLLDLFKEGKTFGSLLIIPEELKEALPRFNTLLIKAIQSDARSRHFAETLLPLVRQAIFLSNKYDIIVTNPPYMGSKGFNPTLRAFAHHNYPDSRSDLFAMFMQHNLDLALRAGSIAMITMQSWMFLSSFEKLRTKLINSHTIISMAHLGARAFDIIGGEVVSTTAFVISNFRSHKYKAAYLRLTGGSCESEKQAELKVKRSSPFFVAASALQTISGSPIAYWVNNIAYRAFSLPQMCEVGATRRGLQTGNKEKFIRNWFECSSLKIEWRKLTKEEALESSAKWFLFNNGGEFRKWYGNLDLVVDWWNDGENIKKTGNAIIPSESLYFKSAVCWARLTTGDNAFRFHPHGVIPGDLSPCFYCDDIWVSMAYFNTKCANYFLNIINPTITKTVGDVAKIPAFVENEKLSIVTENTKRLVSFHSLDWNSFETSWDFSIHPLLHQDYHKDTLEEKYCQLRTYWQEVTIEMRQLEEENNRIFIEAYGLQDELTPQVPLTEITLICNPYYRYGGNKTDEELEAFLLTNTMKELISYAIGCMMGRYSLDQPGLIYAHGGNIDFDPAKYRTFPADPDGIIPITDIEWFPDDAANRIVEFLKVAWPRETLDENLKFLAAALSPKAGEMPVDTIRRYLSTNFFKDHLQTYKKRPIYWLFSSGKERAFQCLVYLHRYNDGTLSRMRNEYVTPLFGKMNARIDFLQHDKDAASSTSVRNKLQKQLDSLKQKLAELTAFDEELRHYADKRIKLDLDDGVKVNYGKFGKLLAEVKAVTGE